MAISTEVRKEITKELTSGGLTKPEIAQRLGVPLAEVKRVAASLWKHHRGFTWK